MRFKIFRVVPICLFLLTGCGTVNVAMKPQSTLTKNSTITVVVQSSDRLGIQGKLEHLLLERGFEIVSEAVAQEKVKLSSESNAGIAAESASGAGKSTAAIVGKSKSEQSLSKVTEVKSSYILRFRYLAYHDFYWVFTSFNATIVNLGTGEVVASVNFSGNRSVDSVLEEFANKLGSSAR